MSRIPVIALDGGPCGGKTTSLSYLKQKLEERGFKVVIVPEAATAIINAGFIPVPGNLARLDFQKLILKTTIATEDLWIETAAFIDHPSDKKVILCDRGAMTGAAYVSTAEFEMVTGSLGYNTVDLRTRRYDAVLFLRSLAVDRPDLYSCENNAARMETPEQAATLDQRTLDAWVGHPHLQIFDNGTDFGIKLKKVLQGACRVLGIPAPLEIERKFLVKSLDMSKLPKHVMIEISQTYLMPDDHACEERVRARSEAGGVAYYHTIKREVKPGVRIENERLIDRTEYCELLRRANPAMGTIKKNRCCFVSANQYFELDFFKNPQGLIVLEIELTEEGQEVALPDFLTGNVQEVTQDRNYSNAAIARSLGQR